LHALCRFFLENSGPAHSSGGHTCFPFLVDMAQLFERNSTFDLSGSLESAGQAFLSDLLQFVVDP